MNIENHVGIEEDRLYLDNYKLLQLGNLPIRDLHFVHYDCVECEISNFLSANISAHMLNIPTTRKVVKKSIITTILFTFHSMNNFQLLLIKMFYKERFLVTCG